ncbi:MAG TPA: hypothetical protein PLM07_06600 [Candidatus Rifleibacterium sp.]|nr:hypothetical protein [Candidatus Rifleibacterium sp.]HPT45550.1 hypothetical protein [Candidatus Rifleibacterium sp.]
MNRILLVLLVFLPASLMAQVNSDITTPFKLWLLNNEARVFSSLAADENLISKVSAPFAFQPPPIGDATGAEESLWETHRKIYVLLDEAQRIYSLARRFGNGRFAIVVKQARPEIWSILPLLQARPVVIPSLATGYRWAFHTTLLKSLGLETERDMDLSARMAKAVKKLSDEEFRLLTDYFSTFAALFPSDASIRVLKGFIETASKKPFGTGLKELLKPSGVLPVQPAMVAAAPAAAPAEPEDPLAELEKLAQFDAGLTASINPEAAASDPAAISNPQSAPTTLEPPPPGVEDLFTIWE